MGMRVVRGQFCANEFCARKGVGHGLCNVCDYVGNYSHPCDSDRGGRPRFLSAFTLSASPDGGRVVTRY